MKQRELKNQPYKQTDMNVEKNVRTMKFHI